MRRNPPQRSRLAPRAPPPFDESGTANGNADRATYRGTVLRKSSGGYGVLPYPARTRARSFGSYLGGRPACLHAPEERQQAGSLQLRSQYKRPWGRAGFPEKVTTPCYDCVMLSGSSARSRVIASSNFRSSTTSRNVRLVARASWATAAARS